MLSTSLETTGFGNASKVSVEPTSHISSRMTTLHKLIAEHTELASLLEQRLHAVLRPTGPETDSNGQGPRASASPIADDLQNFAASLELIGLHYRDILDRLEV